MDDRDFLRELLARPDDDALRSAYADWLEGQGHPGAEFLRVEMELAALTPSDARYAGVLFRMQSLRGRCDRRWVARAGRRYDLRLLTFPSACVQAAVKRIGDRGILTHVSARFKLASLPGVLVAGVSREQAEDLARDLEQIAGKGSGAGGIKYEIVLSQVSP